MNSAIIAVFCIGYLGIALEHKIRIDKASIALLTGGICWTLIMFTNGHGESINDTLEYSEFINEQLAETISEISSILFFLLGAMAIVEVIDAHDGFRIITDNISTKRKVSLLWVISLITFFLSALLDNLTTTIIMAAVLRKIFQEREDLFLFAGMVVLSANAGGAWSPIGDVTTIMLWIGGQISAFNIMAKLILPSLVCLIVPLIYLSFKLKGNISTVETIENESIDQTSSRERITALVSGVSALLFVLFFKLITHLPPFMGMLISLGFMWVGSEVLKKNRERNDREAIPMFRILKRLDLPTMFFFLGILLAVGALETAGILSALAVYLDESIHNIVVINVIIGILSSIVDNVPLVAGAMGMYSFDLYPQDHIFWELLSYCAGTGGSILIIGSAAGVAVMGVLKIDFIWYLKRISILALMGYFSGVITFLLLNQ